MTIQKTETQQQQQQQQQKRKTYQANVLVASDSELDRCS